MVRQSEYSEIQITRESDTQIVRSSDIPSFPIVWYTGK